MFDLVSSTDKIVQSKVKHEKNGSEIKQSLWGELQEDLLLEIHSRLIYSDQVRFRTVNKNWLTAANQCNTKPLPWLINFTTDYRYYYLRQNELVCQLREPSSSSNLMDDPTFVYKIDLKQCGIYPYHLFSLRKTIHKYGWIFCSTTNFLSSDTYFLLISPFTKKSMQFPPLSNDRDAYLLTFSEDPNSCDCVFLLLYDYPTTKRITFKIFCKKYKSWKSRSFDRPEDFEGCGRLPVYICGSFYFVFPVGKLASYNVDRDEWKVESVIGYDIFPTTMSLYFICEAFELNGELMLICIINTDKSGFIARFDWCNKTWVLVESLGNHSLFYSHQSILVSVIGKEERGKGVLPNKMYYRGSYVFSLESGTLSMDRTGITSRDKMAGGGSNYWLYNWIEPPHLAKEAPLWDIRRRNNPKKSFLPFVDNVTDRDLVEKLRNLEMVQTGEQSIDGTDKMIDKQEIEDYRWFKLLGCVWVSKI